MKAATTMTPELSETTNNSTHQLTRRVIRFLSDRQLPGWEGLEVDAEGGTILISGELPSSHSKWLCLECCRRVAGVVAVIDRVVVMAEEVFSFPHSMPQCRKD